MKNVANIKYTQFELSVVLSNIFYNLFNVLNKEENYDSAQWVYFVGKTVKNVTKFRCHDPCHCCLGNVTLETVPNPALQKCAAMNSSTLNCKKCGCSW